MEDIVELSSDSNDTILVPIKENSEGFYDLSVLEENELKTKNGFYNEIVETLTHTDDLNKANSVLDDADKLLKELYAKYLPEKVESLKNGQNKIINSGNHHDEQKIKTIEIFAENVEGDDLKHIQDESDTFKVNPVAEDGDGILKELYAKYLPTDPKSKVANENKMDYFNSHNGNQNEQLKRKISDDGGISDSIKKVTKKQLFEQERNKRKLEQQNKKEIREKQEVLKKTLKRKQKSIDPDECLKNIIVKLDETLIEDFGESITQKLKNNNISFKYVKQDCGRIISWIRKVQTIENLVDQTAASNEKHYLLVLPSKEFKCLVQKNNLNSHIHSLSVQLRFQHLTIVVFGIDKLNDDQEDAVMESEMFFKCYWQFVNKIDDLSSLIFIITKAIAQIPYKLEKQERYKLQNEYFADCNKDTVRVDKDGNGLGRLWNQMLTMLPLARLETAEAISSAYPTPSSLFKAYEECEFDKKELIKNLPIRRANGPLAITRKIGPELSRKCSNFFTSTENEFI